jgi:hypothetical protein
MKKKAKKTKKVRKKSGPDKGCGGRPKKIVDWGQVDRMCAYFCSAVEIGHVIDIHPNTINVACKEQWGKTFKEYIEEKQSVGKCSLRRKQWEMVDIQNSVPMAIHMGKVFLNQVETQKIDHNVVERQKVIYLPENGRDVKK